MQENHHKEYINTTFYFIFYLLISIVSFSFYALRPVGTFEVEDWSGAILNSFFDGFLYLILLSSGFGMFLSYMLRKNKLPIRLLPNILVAINLCLFIYCFISRYHHLYSMPFRVIEIAIIAANLHVLFRYIIGIKFKKY